MTMHRSGHAGRRYVLTSASYRCREILMYEVASERHLDYGFMRLDRHAAAHRAVRLPLTAEPLGTGSRIAAVESGTGLPLKLQVGATVVDGRAETLDYFATNLDMFVGSSGAAVLDSAGALRGVYATGSTDFSYTGECHEYVHLPASEGNERVTYAFQALAGLCEQRPGASSQCSEARSRRADSGCAMRSERIPQSSANRRLVALVALSFIVAAQRRSKRAGHRAGRAPCNRTIENERSASRKRLGIPDSLNA